MCEHTKELLEKLSRIEAKQDKYIEFLNDNNNLLSQLHGKLNDWSEVVDVVRRWDAAATELKAAVEKDGVMALMGKMGVGF